MVTEKVSIQDRYLIIDCDLSFTLRFNATKKIDYYRGRWIVDLYAPLGKGSSSQDIVQNVYLDYPDTATITWQTTDIPMQEMSGVNGQQVQVVGSVLVAKSPVTGWARQTFTYHATNIQTLTFTFQNVLYSTADFANKKFELTRLVCVVPATCTGMRLYTTETGVPNILNKDFVAGNYNSHNENISLLYLLDSNGALTMDVKGVTASFDIILTGHVID